MRKKHPKVAMISDERYPHHATNTQQVIKNASALHKTGIPVDLIIPCQFKQVFSKNYNLFNKIKDYYNVSGGLKFKTLFGFPAGSKWRIEKFTHCLSATIYVSLKKYDIIYTRNEFIALLCLLFRKKVVFETYRRLGDEYPKIMTRLAKRAHKSSFLGMVLHSNLAAESMMKVGFPKEKLIVLHNGYDPSDMHPQLSKKEARKHLELSETKKLIVYTGNMQQNKGLESVIALAAQTPNADFLLVGGTQEDIDRLKAHAASLQTTNVLFAGRQPVAQVATYLYAADVLIIPTVSAPLQTFGRTVLPFKVFPYLAAGRAIIAPNLPDMKEVLKSGHNALLVRPDDTNDATNALHLLLNDESLCDNIGQNALETAEQLTWETRARKLSDWLEKIYQKF